MDVHICSWCASVLIFLGVLGIGNALECYTCTATASSRYDDACKGIGMMKTCADPAVCLSASYSYQDPVTRLQQFTTYKTCYMKNGQECDTFLKAIRASNPQRANIEFTEQCASCQENGCNHVKVTDQVSKPSASSVATLSTVLLVVSLFGCVFNRAL